MMSRKFILSFCLFTVCGVAMADESVNLPKLFYTGSLLPKPQKVLSQWQNYPLTHNSLQFKTDEKPHNAITLGKALFMKHMQQLSTQAVGQGTGAKTVIYLGEFQDTVIQNAAIKFKLNLNDVVLQPEGYAIRCIKGDDGVLHIIAAGQGHRGAFYAAISLLQMTGIVDGKLILRMADLNDQPNWPRRYVSDLAIPPTSLLLEMATWKVNGYAFQLRSEWREFSPEAKAKSNLNITYQQALARLKKFNDKYDLMDMMLALNIYASPKASLLDVSNEKHIKELTRRCRFAANNGIDHIMICVDDWVPQKKNVYVNPTSSEAKRFNGSVGLAHGYLMKRLYEALMKTNADVRLSFCPSVYSVSAHKANVWPHRAAYLRDLAVHLPDAVPVVWTGDGVISPEVKREDYLNYSRLINKKRCFLWDNSAGIDIPIARWNTRFYEGFAEDSGGIIFLNTHILGWQWDKVYTANANDYLWNSKDYDMHTRYANALSLIYGPGKYPLVKSFKRLYKSLKKASPDQRKKITKQLWQVIEKMQQAGLPTGRIKRSVKATISILCADKPELQVATTSQAPIVDGKIDDACWKNAPTFELRGYMKPRKAKNATLGKILYDKNNLYLAFEMQHTAALIVPNVSQKHDGPIFPLSDTVEIFLQSKPNGDYYHFAFDHTGNTYDANKSDFSWDGQWELKITKNKTGKWFAEVKIPFAALQPAIDEAPKTGDIWRVNFGRENMCDKEVTSWSCPYGKGFHTTSVFGLVKF